MIKEAYLNLLKTLKNFRKSISSDDSIKRGKLYFEWLKVKTEKIEAEKDNNYIYENLTKYTLNNYKIDDFSYKKANKELKNIINNHYVCKKKYRVFNNSKISYKDAMFLMKKEILKRGNVVWIDFGFNIGNEFGGMHPAIILKTFDRDLFVLPVSSKMPLEYRKIEKDLQEGKISEEESIKRKNKVMEIVELDDIIGFKKIIRWANITRMKKVSILRLNFSGTIGRVEGSLLEKISNKINHEFKV